MTDEQMRAAFEAWLNPGQHAGNVSPWVEPGRYEKDTHNLAWLAWREATKQAAAAAKVSQAAMVRLSRALGNPPEVEVEASETVEDALVRMAAETIERGA